MHFSVQIIRGDDAHKTRCMPKFISAWQSLANTTEHVTVFQEPAFVNCWYQQYASEFEPIFVLGYGENNQLIGLIPLTIEQSSNILTHAAAQQVEYSGWLCHPKYKNIFISRAIATVNKTISYQSWKWSHIPPHAEIDWLLNPISEFKKIHHSYEKISSPILDLSKEEKINKIKKSKSVKSKINRLKRKGELSLEHITDTARASEVMQLIPDLVNFRHGAAHGDLAFQDDALQHGFYQSRAKNLNENHFSALWMGETLLAFHFGGIDKDTIYIGLTAFDPRESKHSPGVVLILYLAEMMLQQGIRYIDLTPGGDEYKERFCNSHQDLYRPVIYSNLAEKFVSRSKSVLKDKLVSILSSIGIDKESLAKKIQINGKSSQPVTEFQLFTLNLDKAQTTVDFSASSIDINIQNYSDLLIHQGYANSLEMEKLLSDATQRFSKEETLFTLIENKKLVGYAWLSKIGAKYKNHGLDLALDKDHVVIDCIELETKLPNSNVLERLMRMMIAYAEELGVKKLFTFIPVNTSDAHLKVLEKLSFHVS